MREVILASSSKQRHDILRRAGIPFASEDSGYEEDMNLPLAPQQLVEHLAQGKADAVAARHPDAIIIAADTVVVCGAEIFGKPATATRAREMLEKLSGTSHGILTGFVVLDTHTKRKLARTVETRVYFKKLSEQDIQSYVESGESLGKAGGYAIQGAGKRFVERIEGDMDNAVGLPLEAVLKELAKFGVGV